ncbi:MAG: methylmalonyl Co-A mutase-associated GTPase MeaB [Rhizobiales bacterium 24-66-13]|jgi:LAO/AO transport system kinase|nr:MAG: methylmalonyl Co-A mutase-associated GTPase MeaB [Rhizobiales bacterium 12-66-7]OYY80234.1 MAG: methylmalonyl Co-A mutase-associated GTPase MeaB [Rhizobiales bacterium 35-66-30]OYZ81875.1 MAG: methylmalonyl Co-A mutase-associated GTPase MeaB [Rhizobiales bacterium 24-66-13]OZA97597.1 MAG: methylmalonyl Co-A mutase-associated GTPase MeaB [Rhizobiales bacterium 39-66-18]HQS10269.1 ATP/GTP-binding protein [Xanthobacteraceae bacterium]
MSAHIPQIPELDTLRAGGKRAMAMALAAVETARGKPSLVALLDRAAREPKALVLGLTGPPGVGKSTLTNALVRRARAAGRTVAVLAVDPSSRRTGGALLGDRARIQTDPEDRGVFVRSMAARDRLGGLSDDAVAAVVLMRAVFDLVIVETVGVGQSEADIGLVADSVVLCIQPASGDSLQFMKAGVMELPDIIVVTKADMADIARRAAADVSGALSLGGLPTQWTVPVIRLSAASGEGLEAFDAALAAHQAHLALDGRLAAQRAEQEQRWVEEAIRLRFGTEGLALSRKMAVAASGPFSREAAFAARLTRS